MSGASVPLRSLWLGEGLASATTEDSGRNSDATIRAPPGRLQEPLSLAQDEGLSAGGGDCAETAQRDKLGGHGRRGDRSQCRTSLQPSLKKATAGPACRRPGRPTPGRLRPAYATRSTFPTIRYSLIIPDNTRLG